MRYFRCFLSLIVGLTVSSAANGRANVSESFPAQERVGEQVEDDTALRDATLTLGVVTEYARRHNPALRGARYRLQAAWERLPQLSALDDPVLSYEGWNAPENFQVSRADHNIFKLSQKLPFPGKRQLRGQIAEQEALITQADVRLAEIVTRAEVVKTYYDLWRVHRQLAIYAREKELATQFATLAEKKYAVGQVSQPEVLRAQIELTRLAARFTTETLRMGEVKAMLNGLLSRPPEAPLGIPHDAPTPEVRYSFSALTELALSNRPEIAARAAVIERDTAVLTLARKAYLPDFEVGVERFVNSGRKDGVGVLFSATIPFAYREKYDAGVAEATARLSASKAELRAVQDTALTEVKRALVRTQTAAALVSLLVRTHLPQAEQALESLRISYQIGKMDFLSLIDGLHVIEQAHLEHVTAVTDFEKAYADLERAVGQMLPRQ